MKKNNFYFLFSLTLLLLPISSCSKSNKISKKIFCCSMTQQHVNHDVLDFKLETSSYKNGYEAIIIDKKQCDVPEMDDKYDFYFCSIPIDTNSIRISLISKSKNEWMTTGWLPYKNNRVFSFAFNSSNDIIVDKTGFINYRLPVIDFCNIFLKGINVFNMDEINGYLSYPFYKKAFYDNFDKDDLNGNDVKQFSWEDTSYEQIKTVTFFEKWNDFEKHYNKNVSNYNVFDYILIGTAVFMSIGGVAILYVYWSKKRKAV